ncbi:hypothetical protein Tco_0951073, partial [Tanacetum coccineum]
QNRRDLPRDIPLDSVEVLRFYTSARNPVKEILLNVNLPDHRKLKDGGEDKGNVLTERLNSEQDNDAVKGRKLESITPSSHELHDKDLYKLQCA